MPPGEKLSLHQCTGDVYNGKFVNARGQTIYCYYWKPDAEPKALLFISHGYTEHCMIYDELAKEMCQRGFFIFAHDHVGHGHSDGSRGCIGTAQDLVDDVVTHIKIVKEDYPELPVFMCGHSMGGQNACLVALNKEVELNGMVLIGPALASNPETFTLFRYLIVKCLGTYIPSFPVAASDFGLCSRDPVKVKAMYDDPLRNKGYFKAGSIYEMLSASQGLMDNAGDISIPTLILHGLEDKLCHISGSRNFFEKIQSKDKTLKVYEGAYHSLLYDMDEISRDTMDRTVKWLESRV